MAGKKEKKQTSPVFLAVVVVIMLAVFAVHFPTNLGKVYGKQTDKAEEITVTVTGEGGKEDTIGSYYTSSEADMAAFGAWAEEKKMRNRSLADGLTADANKIVKYNFAIKNNDGTYTDLIIDEKGFVHAGAELYMISGSVEAFLDELEQQLTGWGKE